MKSIIITGALLFIFKFAMPQDVSPYTGNNGTGYSNSYTSQLTFFDINYINSKIQSFLQTKLNLSIGKPQTLKKNSDSDYTISYSFQNNGFDKRRRIINFKYNVFPLENYFVIKTLTVSGDINLLIEFWAKYWTTKPNFDKASDKLLVTNRFLQDEISLFGGRSCRIMVENSSIKDINVFKNAWMQSKRRRQSGTTSIDNPKGSEDVRQIRIDSVNQENETEKEKFASRKTLSYDIIVTKKAEGISFRQNYPIELKKAVETSLSNQRNGKYTVKVFENYESGKIYEYQANVINKL